MSRPFCIFHTCLEYISRIEKNRVYCILYWTVDFLSHAQIQPVWKIRNFNQYLFPCYFFPLKWSFNRTIFNDAFLYILLGFHFFFPLLFRFHIMRGNVYKWSRKFERYWWFISDVVQIICWLQLDKCTNWNTEM